MMTRSNLDGSARQVSGASQPPQPCLCALYHYRMIFPRPFFQPGRFRPRHRPPARASVLSGKGGFTGLSAPPGSIRTAHGEVRFKAHFFLKGSPCTLLFLLSLPPPRCEPRPTFLVGKISGGSSSCFPIPVDVRFVAGEAACTHPGSGNAGSRPRFDFPVVCILPGKVQPKPVSRLTQSNRLKTSLKFYPDCANLKNLRPIVV